MAMESPNIHLLILRRCVQALAWAGSTGQGAFLARHCIKVAAINKTPAAQKVQTLYFENVINQGAVLTSPARVAPAPSVTNKAGRAQQIRVPAEVKRLSAGSRVCLFIVSLSS